MPGFNLKGLVFGAATLCAAATAVADDAISAFVPAAPEVPGELLAVPDSGTFLAPTTSFALEGDQVIVRRKSSGTDYALLRGRRSAAMVELGVFPLGKMTPEEALKTRFYRKLHQPKFQDEPVIYVDREFVYCPGLVRLYYQAAGSWKELERVGAGAVEVREIDGTMLATEVREPGWATVRLNAKGKTPRVIGAPVHSGQISRRSLHLFESLAIDTSFFRRDDYAAPSELTDSALNALVDSASVELRQLEASNAKQAGDFDILFGVAERFAPSEIPMGDTAGYSAYLREFSALRESEFGKWQAPMKARIAFVKGRIDALKAASDSLNGPPSDVAVEIVDYKIVHADSAAGQWMVALRVRSSDSLVRGVWRGVVDLPAAEAGALFADLEARKEAAAETAPADSAAQPAAPAPAPAAAPLSRWAITCQGRTIDTPEGPRIYRVHDFKGFFRDRRLKLAGEFSLPKSVAALPQVKEWLDRRAREAMAAKLSAEQARLDSLASAKKAADSATNKTVDLYRARLELLRGRVAEISGGAFVYKGTKVEMSPFAIGATEVTQEHWERLYGKPSASTFRGPKKPVTGVSWTDARNFCQDVGGDLPTEAQWEYAARAGTTTYFYWGPKKGPAAQSHAVYRDNSKKMGRKSPHYGPWKVGSLHPNPWGVYDMAGNVAEWVKDYRTTVRLKIEPKDPQGPTSDMINHFRVFKGGSWADGKNDLEHVKSDWEDPRYYSDRIGFRCAFPANQEPTVEEIEKKLRAYVGDTVEVFPPELRPARKRPAAAADSAKADGAKPEAAPAKTETKPAVAPAKTEPAKAEPAKAEAKPAAKQDAAPAKAEAKPEAAPAKAEAKPAEAKPEAKPAAAPAKVESAKAEAKPAKSETKPAEKKAKK